MCKWRTIVTILALLTMPIIQLAAAENQQNPSKKEEPKLSENPAVVVDTSEGAITIELWPDKAPETVKNFLRYADEGSYDGTIFHRVIDNFMIQGGGFTPDMKPKPTHEPIKNEARADVKNKRGAIAMARTSKIDSATSQFFINVADNEALDHKDDTPRGFGYAVFGRVTSGMDVVDKIRKVRTKTLSPFENVPEKPVIIKSIKRTVKDKKNGQ
jgi:cyclophilin family peptidyl-prolyl cis-trans isomerase